MPRIAISSCETAKASPAGTLWLDSIGQLFRDSTVEYYETNDGQKLRRLPLGGEFSRALGNYGTPNAEFLCDLVKVLQGRKVLEIFAGNGRLAGELDAQGITVTATTVFSSHDKHEDGLYYPVLNLDASAAVRQFQADHDVLLICWPTTTPEVLRAIALWGEDRDIVYIGEVTDYTKHMLGACATDEFFEHIQVTHVFGSHVPRNMLESAFIGRFRAERTPLPGKNYAEHDGRW